MAKGPMFVSVVERKGSNIEMCMKIGHKIMNDRRPTPGNPIISLVIACTYFISARQGQNAEVSLQLAQYSNHFVQTPLAQQFREERGGGNLMSSVNIRIRFL